MNSEDLSKGLVQHSLPTGSFGYSAQDLEDLGAPEYTLVTIAVDTSGSVGGCKAEMEQTIKSIIEACKFSPRADNLMVRLLTFDDNMREVHGFKLLEECKVDDYDNSLIIGGMTALFHSAQTAIQATSDYAKQLAENDFDVNAIVVVITDGDNNRGGTTDDVKVALQSAMRSEYLESLISILVGVGTSSGWANVSQYLDNFKDEAGLTQYVDAGDANAKTLAKLADFVSKSISAQSQALGTNGPSQPLQF